MARTRNRLSMVLVAISLAVVSTAAAGDEVTGFWTGEIDVPAGGLEVRVHLERADDGAATGRISIPTQGARDLPLEVALRPDGATFTIAGVPGAPTFDGNLSEGGDELAGDFTQGGVTFSFRLERTPPPASQALAALDGLDAVIEQALAEFRVAGIAVGVVQDGEVVLGRGWGLRDLEAGLPVTEHTLFAIGSATKAFTTAVLGALVDDGRLEWDRPVRNVLPWFRLADEHATAALTVRDLVSHRSGLPRHDLVWYGADLDREALVKALRHLEPFADLRERYHYQNLMYLTAGVVVEELTGASWEEAVRQRILGPLGMGRTTFSVAASELDSDHALPYRERDDVLERIPFRAIDAMGPAGSINSSVREMLSWVRFQLGDGTAGGARLLSPSTLREMHTPQTVVGRYPDTGDRLLESYGLGWMLSSYRGHYQVEHGGAIDGFTALVSLYPLDGVGVVILANTDGTGLPTLLERHLADRLLGLEPKPWIADGLAEKRAAEAAAEAAEERRATTRVEGTSPARALADYAGDYVHPAYGTMGITVDGDRLVADLHGLTTPLEHWHYEVFMGSADGAEPSLDGLTFSFVTDPAGRLASLSVPLEAEVDPIVFERAVDTGLRDPQYLERFVGTYQIEGVPQRATVAVRGDALALTVQGQPTFDLEPVDVRTFELVGLTGFSVRFVVSDAGEVTGVDFIQPNGVFAATRVE
ncbi:MAG TPA: serine hydrolase [Methylomirabilota bacterium]|nr:serine hydrolase [Methylomirabilota bacterium]